MHYLFSVTRWTCFSALVLLTTAIGLNVMAEDYASRLKLDKNAEASEAFSVKDSKNLNFHAVKIDGVRWFNEDRTLSEWDAYSVFDKVELKSIGYDPSNRDHLEIQIISAEIKPEKVARGVDYARLFATESGASVSAMKEYGRDAGDVFAIGPDNGFERRERVAVWRQDTSLLIIRASYAQDQAQRVEPEIAKFLGALKLDNKEADSIDDAMHLEQLPSSGRAAYSARLPDGWKKLSQNDDPNPSYTGAIFTNSNDPDGNSAVSLFVFPTPKADLAPTDEQLRQLAAKVVEIELQNLMPDVGFKLDEDVSFVPEEKIGDADKGFIDIVTLQGSGQKIRAKTLLSLKKGVVVAIASLTAFPATPTDIATMIHTDFVTRTVRDGLVDQLK
ncbi:hypothetical protein CPJ18_23220 [Agrobacterium rosae]|uniref:Uncharacterized protein n=2 Tax=Agrobacterium rosae TaxID=1972867 RepID=A0AAE5RTM2_9HYPH|nr:hypothetical protein DXM21_22440 [Agrobacterium rosae]KAA3513877.1 hypothetical protein DXM25_22630 [Agrobacterium rosae]MQB50895.1 hypothetical protein [Agrobacterium rosae]POO48889.1 hypothetical protein CPJ18_23220 [Agrobacterium rosae]